MAVFEVARVEVEAREDDGDFVVEGLAVGDVVVVVGLDFAAQRGVGAAAVADVFRGEFLLHAGFAEDEDFVFRGFEFEDAGDVNCGAVAGAEDFFLYVC